MKLYRPAPAPPPRRISPIAGTFETEDGIVAWLLSDPGPDPLPAIQTARAKLGASTAPIRAAEVARIKRILDAPPPPVPEIVPELRTGSPTPAMVQWSAIGRFGAK